MFWLKSGIQQSLIATIFGLDSRQRVADYCAQTCEALVKDFVPQYLGANQRDRETFLQKNKVFSKSLFNMNDSQLCVIVDGTYIYCQKSSNNKLQRMLYSGQKKRPFVKPFLVCCPNGYIVDVYGPYAATQNDASILLHILESNNEFSGLFRDNDVLILDRGFRDACTSLKTKYKLVPKMPACNN